MIFVLVFPNLWGGKVGGGGERGRAERGAGLLAYLQAPFPALGQGSPEEWSAAGCTRVEARVWGAGPVTSPPDPQNE